MEGLAFLENDMAYIKSIQNVHTPLSLICKTLRIYPQVRDTDGAEKIQTDFLGRCGEGP